MDVVVVLIFLATLLLSLIIILVGIVLKHSISKHNRVLTLHNVSSVLNSEKILIRNPDCTVHTVYRAHVAHWGENDEHILVIDLD